MLGSSNRSAGSAGPALGKGRHLELCELFDMPETWGMGLHDSCSISQCFSERVCSPRSHPLLRLLRYWLLKQEPHRPLYSKPKRVRASRRGLSAIPHAGGPARYAERLAGQDFFCYFFSSNGKKVEAINFHKIQE